MLNLKKHANVKNNSTAVSLLSVYCLSQDGITSGTLKVNINTRENLVAGMVSMAEQTKKPTELPKVTVEKGKLSFEANCKGQEVAKGKIVATVPPKFLKASKNAVKTTKNAVKATRDEVLVGRSI